MLSKVRLNDFPGAPKVVESAAPMMERLGVTNVADLHLETLEQRLRDEVVQADAVVFMPTFVGAWVRV